MKRRQFLGVLGGAAAAWPLAARAQQRPVLGILHSQTPESEASRMVTILQGLREAGFDPSRNLTIEHRYAEGRNDRLPALAAELVQRKVDVIFANTTPPANAAKAATAVIPIVFVTGVDPVKVGLVASLNRPGGNVTGVTFLSNTLVAKRLELLSDIAPPATPIGMLAAQVNPNTDADVHDAMVAAKALGRSLHVTKVEPDGDVEPPVTALLKFGVKALFIAPQADFRMWRQQLVLLAARHALPTAFPAAITSRQAD